jgi:hypothetical protein
VGVATTDVRMDEAEETSAGTAVGFVGLGVLCALSALPAL